MSFELISCADTKTYLKNKQKILSQTKPQNLLPSSKERWLCGRWAQVHCKFRAMAAKDKMFIDSDDIDHCCGSSQLEQVILSNYFSIHIWPSAV